MDALVEELGDEALATAADVDDEQQVAYLFNAISERFGGLDRQFKAGSGSTGRSRTRSRRAGRRRSTPT
jgi:NAD(P)-dependent dehydrogenase (short-subunit alcohol dehydrogenase family)